MNGNATDVTATEPAAARTYIRGRAYTRANVALCSRRDLGTVRAGIDSRVGSIGRAVLRVPLALDRACRGCGGRPQYSGYPTRHSRRGRTGHGRSVTTRSLAVVAIAACCVLDPVGAAPNPGGVVRVEHRDPVAAPTRGPTTALVTAE